jgi:glycerophosphoryl diester phosphodiesterase
MRAFELALQAGAEMIELDVRRSHDGQLAILHDPGRGGVMLADCGLDEFAQRTGLRPALLAEVLAWATGRIALDVELKENGYAEELVPLLTGFLDAGGELLVTSFSDALLERIAVLAPRLRLGLLIDGGGAGAVARARAAGARTLLPEMAIVDEALIDAADRAGLELIVWGFMAAEHAPLLCDPRVAAVITDDVPGALRARAALSASQ